MSWLQLMMCFTTEKLETYTSKGLSPLKKTPNYQYITELHGEPFTGKLLKQIHRRILYKHERTNPYS